MSKFNFNNITLNSVADITKVMENFEKIEENGATTPRKYTSTISATGWVGTEEPYTLEVTIEGITATDTPHITPIFSSDYATLLSEEATWNLIKNITTSANKIIIVASAIPTTAINIQLEVYN